MVEVALSMAVLFLLGIVAITIKGGWDLQRRVDALERYSAMITHFSHEISGLEPEEVGKKLEEFVKRKRHELKEK